MIEKFVTFVCFQQREIDIEYSRVCRMHGMDSMFYWFPPAANEMRLFVNILEQSILHLTFAYVSAIAMMNYFIFLIQLS